MKLRITILWTILASIVNAQDKTNYVAYNKLTDLQGTHYVIASVENRSKISSENKYLLFINTVTGDQKQIDFSKDAFIGIIEQVKIDSLQINKVLIAANTINLDGNKSIDWNDPKQIIICEADGSKKTQITEDHFFVSTWVVNKQTGIIVITGHIDSNKNGKYDKTDKNEILLYDLRQMMLIKRM